MKELPDSEHLPKSVGTSPARPEAIESKFPKVDARESQIVGQSSAERKDSGFEPLEGCSQRIPNPAPSAPRPKKRVSFANDTKSAEASHKDHAPTKRTALKANPISPGSYQGSTADVGALEPEIPSIRARSVSTEESYEDAELLRQMLQYNMNEVGAIVAQIDLDENDSSAGNSDKDTDGRESATDDEEDDEYGRTTTRVVDDDYRNKMLELERRLVSKMPENNGVASQMKDVIVMHKRVGKEQHNAPFDDAGATTHESKKKDVRFANELKVVGMPKATAFDEARDIAAESYTIPVHDIVRERESSLPGSEMRSDEPRKGSKFGSLPVKDTPGDLNGRRDNILKPRSVMNGPLAQGDLESWPKPIGSTKASKIVIPTIDANQNRSRIAPQGPPGKTHAAVLVERPLAESSEAITDPDEFDPALMQQEIAAEYYRMRNRMVQRNGGFLKEEDEPAQVSLSELEEAEGGKKISKFKAARLAKLSK